MSCIKEISIIIPHKNSVEFLPTLLASIPKDERLEVIIVDNSPLPITRNDIPEGKDYKLVYSDPTKGAGCARNVGIKESTGKWLLFADADDFFTDGAVSTFLSMADSDCDIIYTCMGGRFVDTGEPSTRGDGYTNLVRAYLNGDKSEMDLRLGFASPCCKLIRRDFIISNKILYDEIIASNDIYFSTKSGLLATKIDARDFVSYIATVSKGSLTQRRDYNVIKSRLYAALHCNELLREYGYHSYQFSIMFYLLQSFRFGLLKPFEFVSMVIKFRQNPFIGYNRWIKGFLKTKEDDKRNKKYILK